MPLSKKRNRERMRQLRLHKPQLLDRVQPKLESVGIKLDGNRIVGVTKPVQPNTGVEVYSPYKQYQPGGRVLVQRGKRFIETVTLELDADGNVIPSYT